MITKIKEFIRHMGLKEDEVIITVEELEKLQNNTKTTTTTEKPKKSKKRRKRHEAKTLWRDKKGIGQIKQYKDGKIKYYCYPEGSGKPFIKQGGGYEQYIQLGTAFAEVNYNKKEWETICEKYIPSIPLNERTRKYIYKDKRGVYIIRKSINGKLITWGSYSDIAFAEEILEYLKFSGWNLKVQPGELLPGSARQFKVDEYYMTMKPVLFADKNYQEYLQNKKMIL